MRAAVRGKGATVRNGQERDLTQYVYILTKLLGRVDARVLRGPLGSFGAPGDVVARCCLVALGTCRGQPWCVQFRGQGPVRADLTLPHRPTT